MSQPRGHNELAASPRLSRAPSCRAAKAHMSHMSHMSRHRSDEGASLWVHARGSQLHIAAKCMTQYAQAKQLPSIAHGEVCEIEARADCAADTRLLRNNYHLCNARTVNCKEMLGCCSLQRVKHFAPSSLRQECAQVSLEWPQKTVIVQQADSAAGARPSSAMMKSKGR